MQLKYRIREIRLIIPVITWRRAFHLVAGFLSRQLSQLSSRPVVWGLPFACSIEPTTRCNLRCPECPTGMGLIHREKGDLMFSVFEKWLDAISKHTSYLTLYLQGEPFLNRDLTAMIKYATQLKIFTCLSTNGHFLSEASAAEIINAGLKKIIVSLDGANGESYRKYRQNGNFESVVSGIKTLVATRKKLGTIHPLVIIQFIVFRSNEHEISAIKELGRQLEVDQVEVKTAQHYNLTAENKLIASPGKYNRYEQNDEGNWELKRMPGNGCSRLWTTSVITWDGKLVACCYDKDAEFAFGNMNESSFKTIWNSEKFMHFRKKVLTDKNTIAMCGNCGEK